MMRPPGGPRYSPPRQPKGLPGPPKSLPPRPLGKVGQRPAKGNTKR